MLSIVMAQQPPVGQGFLINEASRSHSLRQKSLLDKRSVHRRDPLPDNKQHPQETNTRVPAGFEPAIPAGEQLQFHSLDRAATGIGIYSLINNVIKLVS